MVHALPFYRVRDDERSLLLSSLIGSAPSSKDVGVESAKNGRPPLAVRFLRARFIPAPTVLPSLVVPLRNPSLSSLSSLNGV